MKKELYISVDIETTAGSSTPFSASMFQLGACVIGSEIERFVQSVSGSAIGFAAAKKEMRIKTSFAPKDLLQPITFLADLKPLNDNHDPEALKICGVTMDEIKAKGRDPALVMKEFADWVLKVSDGAMPVFVGLCAPFDWMFVAWYFDYCRVPNPFKRNTLDIKAYFGGMMNAPWQKTVATDIKKDFPVTFPHTHNALDDAKGQAEMFQKMKLYNLVNNPHTR